MCQYEATRLLHARLSLPDRHHLMMVHEKRLAARENVPIDEQLRRRVRQEFPPPANIDFRMFVGVF